MAAKHSLFAVSSAPADDAGDDDDYSGDSLPADEESEPADTEPGGPFDAYAETVLDAKAPMGDRVSALREAILTLLEEQGSGSSGGGSMSALGGMNSVGGGMGGPR